MTDNELLELAAKAAGIEVEIDHNGVFHIHQSSGQQSWQPWNPLTDDGDAMRLIVKVAEFTAMTGDLLQESDYRRAIVEEAAGVGAKV